MRDQRFENKKADRYQWEDNSENSRRKQKMANHKDERNWKNKLLKDDDEEIDDNFLRYDD